MGDKGELPNRWNLLEAPYIQLGPTQANQASSTTEGRDVLAGPLPQWLLPAHQSHQGRKQFARFLAQPHEAMLLCFVYITIRERTQHLAIEWDELAFQ
ncbi:hypothetical protein D9M71_683030 [compost metagenome]